MQDREHSALLQQDDDPEWQKGIRHPINRSGQHGHHLQTGGGLVMAMQLKPCAQPATLDAFFT
jgi:hypothetical protein